MSPHHTNRGLRERHKLPKRGSGQSQNDQLQHILINRDKFSTGFGIRDNSVFPMTSYFFRDGPSKFGTVPNFIGTDGHLNTSTNQYCSHNNVCLYAACRY